MKPLFSTFLKVVIPKAQCSTTGETGCTEETQEGTTENQTSLPAEQTLSKEENCKMKCSLTSNRVFGSVDCEICCFENILPNNQTKCPKNHKFCQTCAKKMAEQELLHGKTNFQCMSMKGCEENFSKEEINKFLTKVLYEKWQEIQLIRLCKDLQISFNFCPFCDFKSASLGLNEQQPMFICGNKDCRKWSCRNCKNEDHSPLTCEEAKTFLIGSESNQINDFLSEAIIRRCPNKRCSFPIEKIEGCNHITCSNCGTHFCYLCQENLSSGRVSTHFGKSLGLCDLNGDPSRIIAKNFQDAKDKLKSQQVKETLLEERKKALQKARWEARMKLKRQQPQPQS